MSTYLDKLSMMSTEDEEPVIDNDIANMLLTKLFNNIDYATLQMNFKQTGYFDTKLFEKCIVDLWKHCDGMADIQQCCYVTAIGIEEVHWLTDRMLPTIHKLIAKYGQL